MIEKTEGGAWLLKNDDGDTKFIVSYDGVLLNSNASIICKNDDQIIRMLDCEAFEHVRTSKRLNGEAIRVFNVPACDAQLRLVEQNGSRTWEVWEEPEADVTWGRP